MGIWDGPGSACRGTHRWLFFGRAIIAFLRPGAAKGRLSGAEDVFRTALRKLSAPLLSGSMCPGGLQHLISQTHLGRAYYRERFLALSLPLLPRLHAHPMSLSGSTTPDLDHRIKDWSEVVIPSG